MLTRLKRLFKHRWIDDSQHTIPPALQESLARRVAASERHHSGEIRIFIEAGLPLAYLLRDSDIHALARQRALSMFGKLRVWDTANNNGVLIYLLLAERAIEIVADRGLNDKIAAKTWHEIMSDMREAFTDGDFERGMLQALDSVSQLQTTHFQLAPGEHNPNELTDKPFLG